MDSICHFKWEIYLADVEYVRYVSKQCANSCTNEIIWDEHIHMYCPLESGIAWSHGLSFDKNIWIFVMYKVDFYAKSHIYIYIYIYKRTYDAL